jgi:hypothetical protein
VGVVLEFQNCRGHYGNSSWINLQQVIDTADIPLDILLIATNFSAALDLHAKEADK